uniref:Uncharacterized protein n=1 Tax=Rangifer tarandus platyrhynchus TaxID=3082113 RepID=A0ACB0FIB5_RANTA|nr:unnamed protein product [Rangifer tarandus platyrhynchus]
MTETGKTRGAREASAPDRLSRVALRLLPLLRASGLQGAGRQQPFPRRPGSPATRASGSGGEPTAPGPCCSEHHSPGSPGDPLEAGYADLPFAKAQPEDPRGAVRQPGPYRTGLVDIHVVSYTARAPAICKSPWHLPNAAAEHLGVRHPGSLLCGSRMRRVTAALSHTAICQSMDDGHTAALPSYLHAFLHPPNLPSPPRGLLRMLLLRSPQSSTWPRPVGPLPARTS